MKNYISIKIAPYCIKKLLLALSNEGINKITITQEDNDLIVRIDTDDLKDYTIKKSENGIKELNDER